MLALHEKTEGALGQLPAVDTLGADHDQGLVLVEEVDVTLAKAGETVLGLRQAGAGHRVDHLLLGQEIDVTFEHTDKEHCEVDSASAGMDKLEHDHELVQHVAGLGDENSGFVRYYQMDVTEVLEVYKAPDQPFGTDHKIWIHLGHQKIAVLDAAAVLQSLS